MSSVSLCTLPIDLLCMIADHTVQVTRGQAILNLACVSRSLNRSLRFGMPMVLSSAQCYWMLRRLDRLEGANLKLYAGVRTTVTTCDGASTFRLAMKYNTSGAGRGTANHFVTTTLPNDIEEDDDPEAVLNMTSDSSHWMKKGASNLYSSGMEVKKGSTTKAMEMPDYLVQMLRPPLAAPGLGGGR